MINFLACIKSFVPFEFSTIYSACHIGWEEGIPVVVIDVTLRLRSTLSHLVSQWVWIVPLPYWSANPFMGPDWCFSVLLMWSPPLSTKRQRHPYFSTASSHPATWHKTCYMFMSLLQILEWRWDHGYLVSRPLVFIMQMNHDQIIHVNTSLCYTILVMTYKSCFLNPLLSYWNKFHSNQRSILL